jgi:hypothetical protein
MQSFSIAAFWKEYLSAIFWQWWALAFVLFGLNEMSEWLFKRSWHWIHNHRVIVAGCLIIVAQALAYKTLSDKSKADLRMSVRSYHHNRETNELVADVQFVNNGNRRRTVTNVSFYCRINNRTIPVVNSDDEFFGHDQTAVDVDPGSAR